MDMVRAFKSAGKAPAAKAAMAGAIMASSMQALIFDCDGVLVDTERDGHRVAFNKAFADLGIDAEWSIERYGELLKIAGGKERMTRHFDETRWPVEEGDRGDLIKKLHERKTAIFMELLDGGGMVLRPGVARLVDEAIAAGIPIAVCSTSAERAVNAVVERKARGRARQADQGFCGRYRASARSRIRKSTISRPRCWPSIRTKCVVIEDSQNGLEAAKAAGMNCIVTISSYTGGEDFRLADRGRRRSRCGHRPGGMPGDLLEATPTRRCRAAPADSASRARAPVACRCLRGLGTAAEQEAEIEKIDQEELADAALRGNRRRAVSAGLRSSRSSR